MEQAFRVEIKDYLQINTYLVNRSPRWKFIRIVRRSLMPLIAAGVCFFDQIPLLFAIPIVAVVGAISYLLQTNVIYQGFKNGYATDMTGVCTISITPEEFRFQNPTYAISARWEKMTDVTQSPRHLIFMLLPLRSFVIPKTAFADEEHARAFFNTALAYQAGTHTDHIDTPGTTAWPPPPDRRRL
ncbi:MAG: YcxB family protein [Capsulimonas sp.]|uniref:YcxB family protein n=1 Tax=Capsulimonas sp. TaxID=2494211 RepID=UPI0032655A87